MELMAATIFQSRICESRFIFIRVIVGFAFLSEQHSRGGTMLHERILYPQRISILCDTEPLEALERQVDRSPCICRLVLLALELGTAMLCKFFEPPPKIQRLCLLS